MDADIKGALNQINTSWKAFEHNGKPMTKAQVKAVLTYADAKGYKTTNQIPDKDIDLILKKLEIK